MGFISNLLGSLMKFIFDVVSKVGTETELISYYGITIILTTIVFKLILLPVSFNKVNLPKDE